MPCASTRLRHCNREKRVSPTLWDPPLSICRTTPRSQSKKGYGAYHFLGKTTEKGIHHRPGKKGIHHRGFRPRKRKKGGFLQWWCILFSSLLSQNGLGECSFKHQESSVSSSFCVPRQTHPVSRRAHRENSLSSLFRNSTPETVVVPFSRMYCGKPK